MAIAAWPIVLRSLSMYSYAYVQCLFICAESDQKCNMNLRKDKDMVKEDLAEIRGVLCSSTVDEGIRRYLKGCAEIC